ncbi:MAG: hypothetical protein R3F17_09260 [Planctomycetota bacterium]
MTSRIPFILLAGLIGSFLLITALGKEVADLDIRVSIPRTPTGKTFLNFPPGQLFRCDFQDLQRIDLKLIQQGGEREPELVLELRRVPEDQLERFASQPVLRSAKMEWTGDGKGPDWAVFRFDPVPNSKGGLFHLRLLPAQGRELSNWAPFVSMRSTLGTFAPWGPVVRTQDVQVEFQSPFWDLACLAFGADGLDAAAAHSYVDLFEVPEDGSEPKLVRQGELHHQGPIASGYAFFLFDPIPESRWKRYRAVLHMPKNGRIVGTDSGPAYLAYHGLGEVSRELVGQTLGPNLLPGRDLIFRAYGEDGLPSNWALLKKRGASGRFLLALVLWSLAAGLALHALVAARSQRP